jgi:hypothetical protein
MTNDDAFRLELRLTRMDVDANLTMATRFKTSAREEGKYKGRLVFCGDGADTWQILTFGTPAVAGFSSAAKLCRRAAASSPISSQKVPEKTGGGLTKAAMSPALSDWIER